MNLTSYRITRSDGTSYVTSMAAGVTLEDAKTYFLGQRFIEPDEVTTWTAVNVEVAP